MFSTKVLSNTSKSCFIQFNNTRTDEKKKLFSKGKGKPLLPRRGFSFPFNPILFWHGLRALPLGNPFVQTLLIELSFGVLHVALSTVQSFIRQNGQDSLRSLVMNAQWAHFLGVCTEAQGRRSAVQKHSVCCVAKRHVNSFIATNCM